MELHARGFNPSSVTSLLRDLCPWAHNSSATPLSQEEQVDNGDLFVGLIFWDVGKKRGWRGCASEKVPQRSGICVPHRWDNHSLPAPQRARAGKKGTKSVSGTKAGQWGGVLGTPSPAEEYVLPHTATVGIPNQGIALRHLLLERAIQKKIKSYIYISNKIN